MRIIKLRLPVYIELTSSVMSSTKLAPDESADIPDFLQGVGNAIADVISSKGFEPDRRFPFKASKINGGYSLYTTFDIRDEDTKIILDLDIRLSDHPSKPNLKSSVQRSTEKLQKVNLGNADASVLDIYCKKYGWGVQIYVGTDSDAEYRKPFNSIEAFTRMLNGRLDKVLSKYEG